MGSCIGRRSEVHIHAITPSKSFGQNNALLDKWSSQQVKLLSQKFNEYKTTEGLDFDGFKSLFKDSTYFPEPVIRNCFALFALKDFNVLNFRSFCVLIAQLFLSAKAEKSQLIFKIFDFKGNGVWTLENLQLFNQTYKEFCRNAAKPEISYNGNLDLSSFIEWSVKFLDFSFILNPFELIPSPDKEKQIITSLLEEFKPKEGTIVYLIYIHWWDTWKNYVNFGREFAINKSINIGDRPVSIDNKPLFKPDSELRLRTGLKKEKDYVLVTEKVWNILQEWYEGGPKIARKYIMHSKALILELYPPILKVIPIQNNGYPSNTILIEMQFSETNKFSEVLEQTSKALNRPYDNSRILIKQKNQWIVPTLTEEISQKIMDEEIMLETYVLDNHRAYWPRDLIKDKLSSYPSNSITASSSNSEDSKRSSVKKMTYSRAARIPGYVGLMNLGNTCYFNCIVQALVHTPLLQEFFSTSNIQSYLNKRFTSDDSISIELSNLSREIWAGTSAKLNPVRLFKHFTTRFPMFEGKEQHDCHEFLSMLLDALHEELRREGDEAGKSTVILENPENKMLEIAESDKQWQLLQGTQGSIVSDICAGQTKTSLTCEACGAKRILFEIFTNLSLPIPIVNLIPVYITLIPQSSAITKTALMISKYSKVKEVIDHILEVSQIPIEKLSVIEPNVNYNINNIEGQSNSSLESIGINSKVELYAFELNKTIESWEGLGRITFKTAKGEIMKNSQVDVFHNERWTTGRVLDVRKQFRLEYLVDFDYLKAQEWKGETEVDRFRSHTNSMNSAVSSIILVHLTQGPTRKTLGFPFLLSIGNWYTYDDLYTYAHAQASRMMTKDLKPRQDCFKLLIIDPFTLKCGICRSYENCLGCPLLRNRTEIRSLNMNYRRFCIGAEWNESFFSEDIKYHESVVNVKEKEKEINKPIDISMCLEAFTKEERLDMTCEKCKNKAMKMKMEIWRAPDILILNMKRFTYSNGVAEKIHSLVNYPFFGLEIAHYVKGVEQSQKLMLSTSGAFNSYDLYAVILHSGSIHGGHYTTLLKLDSWILFDDESTLELKDSPENSNLISESYLLFYRRRRFSSSNVINLTYNSI